MTRMTTLVSDDDTQATQAECWCCGAVAEPSQMIRLGNHPEVSLCARCGHWAGKQAWELDDRGKTGPLVTAREQFRSVRRQVVQHGWHHAPLVGGVLRRLGRWLP